MGIRIDDPATPSSAAPLSLGRFILDNMEGILQDWQEYAQSLFPDEVLSKKTLRDHAKQLLEAIAADISQPQSSGTQQAKSKGLKPENSPALKIAGEQHALARVAEEFDLEQIISEFRAVRGSVLQRWAAEGMSGSGRPAEISRFNESVDEALAASARHYASTHRSIVDTSSDAIVGKTPAGIITSWNKGAERIFGYTAEEAIGRSTAILFPVENLNDELDILARIGRGEQVQNFDAVRVRKDGSQVHVSVTVSPITDKRGNVIGASKIARDITQRIEADTALRVSEERFRVMANSIPQLAWTARADGFIDWYNQRWYDYTGTTLAQTEGWD
jgi:PAS domain S-box-containing protein